MSNKIKNYASHDYQSKGQEMLSRPNAEQSACKMHEQTQRRTTSAAVERRGARLQTDDASRRDPKLLAIRILRKRSNSYLTSDW